MEQKTEASQAVEHFEDDRNQWTFKQWYKLVGAWETPEGFISFGSPMAVRAMLIQYATAILKAQPAPTEAAQGEDSARLDADMLALLIREAGILNERGMAWLLNGESISLNLNNLLAIANMIEARASAETGGVKP